MGRISETAKLNAEFNKCAANIAKLKDSQTYLKNLNRKTKKFIEEKKFEKDNLPIVRNNEFFEDNVAVPISTCTNVCSGLPVGEEKVFTTRNNSNLNKINIEQDIKKGPSYLSKLTKLMSPKPSNVDSSSTEKIALNWMNELLQLDYSGQKPITPSIQRIQNFESNLKTFGLTHDTPSDSSTYSQFTSQQVVSFDGNQMDIGKVIAGSIDTSIRKTELENGGANKLNSVHSSALTAENEIDFNEWIDNISRDQGSSIDDTPSDNSTNSQFDGNQMDIGEEVEVIAECIETSSPETEFESGNILNPVHSPALTTVNEIDISNVDGIDQMIFEFSENNLSSYLNGDGIEEMLANISEADCNICL